MNSSLTRLTRVTILVIQFGLCLPVAQAQLGIGFGVGNGFRGGPSLWGGGYGGGGGGGFYGMGVTIAPNHYTTPLSKNEFSNSANKNLSQTNPGSLDGYVKLCAPASMDTESQQTKVTTPIKQPKAICRPSTETMQNVAIVANPYSLNQWIGTKPDASGHYYLLLMPGGYLVQASTPSIQNQRPLEVIIEPNQATRQDFQIGP